MKRPAGLLLIVLVAMASMEERVAALERNIFAADAALKDARRIQAEQASELVAMKERIANLEYQADLIRSETG